MYKEWTHVKHNTKIEHMPKRTNVNYNTKIEYKIGAAGQDTTYRGDDVIQEFDYIKLQ